MIGIVVVSHSARLAEGVVELARQMGGEEVAITAAGGIDDPEDPIGTDAFAIKQAIEQAWSPDGVLVLMDLGSAVMNAETALDLLEAPYAASRVLLCEAPLVEGAVAAAATARIGASLEQVASEARQGLVPKVEHLAPAAEVAEQDGRVITGPASSIRLSIPNPLGLHLRPAGRLVETAGGFDAEVELRNLTTGAGPVSARSISRVSSLGAAQGHLVEVRAQGRQAEEVLAAIESLAAEDFGDRPAPPPAAVAVSPQPVAGVISGVAASPGVAMGPARHLQRPRLEAPRTTAENPEAEWSRLTAAIESTRSQVQDQRRRTEASAGEDEAVIFAAHLMVLADEALLESARHLIDQGQNAEAAWIEAVEEAAALFRSLDDPYQAERAADVEAVGDQVMSVLLGVDSRPSMSGPGVLVAPDLTPGETAMLDPEAVDAIVTSRGGATSHSAILARAMGIPAVVGVGPVEIAEGTILAVDGAAGTVELDPTPETVALLGKRIESEAVERRESLETAALPAVTVDGSEVEVAANIGAVDQAKIAVEHGADGVGLLRTEFLFLDRDDPPSVEEQEEAYRAIAEALGGRPMVLRTLDIGGDKPLAFLDRPAESNPFLGVRGIRLALAHPDLLLDQLRAAMRVAAHHPVRLMFPMVATIEDWEQGRAMVSRVGEEMGGEPLGLEVGVMVEVPSLPLVAERYAEQVDFFSVGTNDLTQYTLAADRGNPELDSLADGLHPAVLALIQQVCSAASRHGRWVGVCGELAADPVAIPILLGLGVTELSMSPYSIPRAKQTVRAVGLGQARDLAQEALTLSSAGEVRALSPTN